MRQRIKVANRIGVRAVTPMYYESLCTFQRAGWPTYYNRNVHLKRSAVFSFKKFLPVEEYSLLNTSDIWKKERYKNRSGKTEEEEETSLAHILLPYSAVGALTHMHACTDILLIMSPTNLVCTPVLIHRILSLRLKLYC